MSDTVILFEDEGYRLFLPLTHTRPVFDLRVGALTARERLAVVLGQEPNAICRTHLASFYGAGRWPLALLGGSEPVTLVNGRALDLDWLARLGEEPPDTVYVADPGPGVLSGGVLLGARLSPALASAVLLDLLQQESDAALRELRRFARVVETQARLLTFPWDIITCTGEQIVRDAPLLAGAHGWASAADRPIEGAGVVVHNPAQVFVRDGARLDGPLVLDARDGPVVVDAAHVEPFSFVQGPAAIGEGALISSARIRAETAIGPVCRIGGEVEASVVQGYSNKHHDGFLGHSYLGEWVNIGAMTTNSDLKNTYGSVKMALEGFGQVDSGHLKLGCFLADHVKLGIGMHLNGGAVIGTGSNLFGVHFAPKTVPPFTWGGEVFREYRIDRMVEVARKVMGRRKIALAEDYETMLRDVFVLTRSSRTGLVDSEQTQARRGAAYDREAALASAEQAAVQSFG